jgi:hypothetical protein
MAYWENVPDKNIKEQETSFKKHHSNIPCIGQKFKFPKTYLNSLGYIYFKTLN